MKNLAICVVKTSYLDLKVKVVRVKHWVFLRDILEQPKNLGLVVRNTTAKTFHCFPPDKLKLYQCFSLITHRPE